METNKVGGGAAQFHCHTLHGSMAAGWGSREGATTAAAGATAAAARALRLSERAAFSVSPSSTGRTAVSPSSSAEEVEEYDKDS